MQDQALVGDSTLLLIVEVTGEDPRVVGQWGEILEHELESAFLLLRDLAKKREHPPRVTLHSRKTAS